MINESGDERLFHTYAYLCRRGARKFVRDGLERADLEQVAAIGLIKACRRYDEGSGTPFEAFAWVLIVGELMHFVRDHERPVRIPRWLRKAEKTRAAAHEALVARLEREPTEQELLAEMDLPGELLAELHRASCLTNPGSLEDERATIGGSFAGISIDDRLALEQGLTLLPEVERKILIGIYQFGLTQAEVARAVSLSPRHVSRLHRKAINTMQAFWSEDPGRGHSPRQKRTKSTRRGAIDVNKAKVKTRLDEQNGFTLLELMIVVAIIAIIAAILVPNFFHARAQAAVSACEANIRSIATALELYYTDHQAYPATGAVNAALFTGANGAAGSNVYLTQTPRDPGATDAAATYQYTAPAGANLAYQIDCPGTHPANALASIPGGANADSQLHYDSSNGFSAVAKQ